MKTLSSSALPIAALVTALCSASCATVDQMTQGPVAFIQKSSSATTSKISKLSELAANTIRPAQVQVVEVREKDLKVLPTGQERALAFQNSSKRNFWFFNGPVDFQEPTLPEAGMEMDGSLLPPLAP
jgi:hypothetical protein